MDRGDWWAAIHGVEELDTTEASQHACMHWRRKWQPTLVFLPGEAQGWRSLVGCCLWGCTESVTTEVTQQQQQQQRRTIMWLIENTKFCPPLDFYREYGFSSSRVIEAHSPRGWLPWKTGLSFLRNVCPKNFASLVNWKLIGHFLPTLGPSQLADSFWYNLCRQVTRGP